MIGVLSSPTDYTWDIVEQFHWSYLEVNLGILCASVPALQPFMKQYLGPVFSSRLRSSKGESNEQPQPYSTAIKRNAERRERRVAKAHGYELESRDDRSEDGPFKHMTTATGEDEAQLWRLDDAHHATMIISERHGDDWSDLERRIPVGGRPREASPQGISVKKETSVKYNA